MHHINYIIKIDWKIISAYSCIKFDLERLEDTQVIEIFQAHLQGSIITLDLLYKSINEFTWESLCETNQEPLECLKTSDNLSFC